MSMDNLDFRSIKVILNLYKTRNTYVTAEELDLSQSAVARILAKCRHALNEPLFIRSGNQLSPTAFTEALVEKLPSLLNGIEEIVATKTEFDPKQLTGRYQIFLNRQSQLIYGRTLFELLRRDAPKASWYIKGWDSTSAEQLLDDRAVIGVNYYSSSLPNSICQETLADEVFVLLAHEEHPLHRLDNITNKELSEYDFVSLALPFIDEKSLYLDSVLQEIGVEGNIALQTDNLMFAMQVAENMGLLLLSTIDVANYPNTTLKPLKYETDKKYLPDSAIVCTYARKNRNKPIVKWIKSIFAEVAALYPPPS
ncbi:LysR substrate-binding domain-containing protein [Vibrio mediterranei]|uniref:LysR substrate-binding domain-containing protein n=1 Tax=Vibrio mediterranei TaxID=689 RepID=UPI0040696C1B